MLVQSTGTEVIPTTLIVKEEPFLLIDASTCWAAADTETQFTVFDSSASKMKLLSAPREFGAFFIVKVSIE